MERKYNTFCEAEKTSVVKSHRFKADFFQVGNNNIYLTCSIRTNLEPFSYSIPIFQQFPQYILFLNHKTGSKKPSHPFILQLSFEWHLLG